MNGRVHDRLSASGKVGVDDFALFTSDYSIPLRFHLHSALIVMHAIDKLYVTGCSYRKK